MATFSPRLFRLIAPITLVFTPGCFDAGTHVGTDDALASTGASASGGTDGERSAATSDDDGVGASSAPANGIADEDTAGEDTAGTDTAGTDTAGTDTGADPGGSGDAGSTDADSGGTDTPMTEGTTGAVDPCPTGSEGCACDVGAACEEALYCADGGLCLFEGMVAVPAGEFEMGCNILTDNQCQDDEYALHTVDLGPFQIGRTEVSQGEYQVCVAAGACETPTQNYDPVGTPDLPVVRINWLMAQTYCQWQGGRLPTEGEWAKTARGTGSPKYPWGNAVVNCELANYNACGGSLVDVDSYPEGASPYGALHMVGNVGEWVEDWYEAPFGPNAVSDPTGPDSGTQKVTRSQPFSYGNQDARGSFRSNWAPSLLSGGVGVRCARDLPL